MLQQRKHAWPERKKKPKSEMTAGKVSSHPSGRFHKTSSHRQHEGGRISFSDGNAAGSASKGPPGGGKMSFSDGNTAVSASMGPPGGGRTFRKCSLAISQFLPPIKALAMKGSLALQAKQSSVLLGEATVREPEDAEVSRTEGSPKTSEKENYDSAGHKGTSGLGSSPGCAPSRSVHLPNHWQEKTFLVKESAADFPKPPARKVPTPDLYKSCLLVLSTRREGRKDPKARQVPEILRSPAGRPQTRSKTPRKDLLTWRSTEDLLKGGEKRSSGDSAFGTDTWSENVEVDLGLEVGGLEMDYYTQQRIINWILQVNTALFSPSADSLKCSLTEQDTSIKIVYEGD